MVVVPTGGILMGSNDGDYDEKLVHHVRIPIPFSVGKFEVTFSEVDACVSDGGCSGPHPGDAGWGRDRGLVINVARDLS
jgi:formylglycine-generating enzyme required for sulfatase activity